MSWNGYIDSIIGYAPNDCNQACIIGFDGSQWTTADHAQNFNLKPEQAVKIAGAIKAEDCSTFQASGVLCGDIKFQFLRYDEGIVLAKRKEQGAITIQPAKTAIVIAHTKEGATQGNTKGVDAIVKYLESVGM